MRVGEVCDKNQFSEYFLSLFVKYFPHFLHYIIVIKVYFIRPTHHYS